MFMFKALVLLALLLVVIGCVVRWAQDMRASLADLEGFIDRRWSGE